MSDHVRGLGKASANQAQLKLQENCSNIAELTLNSQVENVGIRDP